MSGDSFDVILHQYSLKGQNEMDEAAVIEVLAERIAEMLDHETELLFSTLYRLDVSESRINMVLQMEEDTARGLARLVLERQKEKIRTRQQYASGDKGDPFDPESLFKD